VILGKVDEARLSAEHLVCNLCFFERPRISQRPTLDLATVVNCISSRHDIARAVAQTRSHLLVQIGFLVGVVARIERIQIAGLKTAGLLNALAPPVLLLRLLSRLVIIGLSLWCRRGT